MSRKGCEHHDQTNKHSSSNSLKKSVPNIQAPQSGIQTVKLFKCDSLHETNSNLIWKIFIRWGNIMQKYDVTG